MLHNRRLIAGMARQANLSALDAMIAAAGADSSSTPHLADLAAELTALASRTAEATEEMREQVEGTSGGDEIAATLTAMRDAALGITETLRQHVAATAAKGGDSGVAELLTGNAING